MGTYSKYNTLKCLSDFQSGKDEIQDLVGQSVRIKSISMIISYPLACLRFLKEEEWTRQKWVLLFQWAKRDSTVNVT